MPRMKLELKRRILSPSLGKPIFLQKGDTRIPIIVLIDPATRGSGEIAPDFWLGRSKKRHHHSAAVRIPEAGAIS